jgi:hypothetical protein
MYGDLLIPEDLVKTFTIEDYQRVYDEEGGYTQDWVPTGTLSGILADAGAREYMRAQATNENTSHTINQEGPPQATDGQRLRGTTPDGREEFYLIESVDNPGGLGIWTIYYVERRSA